MKCINIANRCVVQMESSITTLLTEFVHHIQESDGGLPVVGHVIKDVSLTCPANAVMLLDNKLYTDNKNLFILEGGRTYQVELTEHSFSIVVNGIDAAGVLPMLVQYLLVFYLPQYNLVFLHTAAYLMGKEVVAIHGFGGAGKTEVMLSMLQRGAMYLADDFAIFDTEGTLFPYLRRISLHDYPYTDIQLRQFHLSRWRYQLMNRCKHKSGRIQDYIYRRYRGRFNICIDYLQLTDGKITRANQPFVVNRHFWLDSCNATGLRPISKERFVRNMSYCMQNESRSYLDFDGYCGLVYPFWKDIRTKYHDVMQNVFNMIDIYGLTIAGQHYDELADLLDNQSN